MLRGMRKASSQLARADRHGDRARPDRHQLCDLGNRRHLPRIRPVHRREDRLDRDHGHPVPPDLQRSHPAARPRARPPDHAGSGQAVAPRPAARRPARRRSRARPARAPASPQRLGRRGRAADHERSEFKAPNGQFDRARFEQLIRNAGFTEQRFTAEQKRLTMRREVADTVSAEIAPPKTMADAQNRYDNEQRAIDYVVLDSAKAGEVPAPTPEAIAKYYDEHKSEFRTPEYRTVAVLSVAAAGPRETRHRDGRGRQALLRCKRRALRHARAASARTDRIPDARGGAGRGRAP